MPCRSVAEAAHSGGFGRLLGHGPVEFPEKRRGGSLRQRQFRRAPSGPIRSITEAIFEYNKSTFVYHVISYARFPVIEYRIRIHWNEERKHLKLSVPTIYDSPGILCEVPGGAVLRPADGEQHVHGRWFIAENGVSAIGVVNSGQHGIDFFKGEARLSVLRSAAYCHEQGKVLDNHPYRKFMDQGVHDIRLLVIGRQSRPTSKTTSPLMPTF